MAFLFDTGIFAAVGSDSSVLSGAKIYFYTAGTSTPKDTYTSIDLDPLSKNTNPVVADANGRWPAIWLTNDLYKIVLKTSGDVTIETRDDVGPSALVELATTTGAGMLGYSRAATYSPGTVGKKLQQNRNPLDAPYSATGDGVADDRAALFAADQAGAVTISVRHRVASNLTFVNIPTFVGAGGLIPDAGVTITMPGRLNATLDRQIFFGSGVIAGLDKVNVAWFAGDSAAGVNATASIQKALNACNNGGEVIWDRPYYSDGVNYLEVQKGQNIISPGRTRGKLLWTTAACLGFHITGTEGASIRGIMFDPQSANTIPTSGDAVLVEAVNCAVMECLSGHCYGGIHWKGVNGGKDVDNKLNGSMVYSNWIENSPNIEITNANCSAFSDWVDVSTTAGFIAGESITFASGGTGSWGYTTSATRAKIIINDKSPSVSTTITGATSGATCTLTTLTKGHRLGGLLLTANAAGFNIVGSAWAGGVKSGACDATVDAHGTRPEYGAIVSGYFDHADEGFQLLKGAGIRLSANWYSARFGDGLHISGTHTMVDGCTISHSWNNGILLDGQNTIIKGNVIQGNNRSNAGKAGVYVIANTSDFIIQDNRIGGATAAGFDGTQAKAVNVEVGTSDRYVIKNNLINGNTAGVSDGGTGVNKAVGENY